MKLRATIDGVALAALVFAVVAISAVSAVAIISAESLIANNEKALRMQRTVSSLEAIRFHSTAVESSEQSYVITGRESDLASYRAGTVEIEAEVAYLSGRRAEHPDLDRRFTELKELVRKYVAEERKIVEVRRTKGEPTAREMVRKHVSDASHDQLLQITYQLLVSARKQMDALEAEQVAYGDKVRRLILALISSAAFVLVFLYGSLHKLSIEQRIAQTRIAHQATHDSLTGLHNRSAVMDLIARKLEDGEREASLGGFALLLLDLDGFKAVNDNFGHDAGDELLRQVSSRIEAALRDSDFVARLGGDEFLIVVPQVSDRGTAHTVGKKIIAAVAKPYLVSSRELKMTASIGISMFPENARDREGLMKCADLAMYEAKHAGGDQICFFSTGLCGGNHQVVVTD